MSFIGLSSVFSCHALLGMHTGFKDSSGNIAFSEEFVRDYNAAEFTREPCTNPGGWDLAF